MSDNTSTVDSGVIARRSLFFLLLVGLTLTNLFLLFRGLSSPQAMDQAQIAREIARGNGFTTKFIRPAAYHEATKAHGAMGFKAFQDAYHAPLYPLVNAAVLKVIGAGEADTWKMEPNKYVYDLDRIIAAVSTLFFLMAIGVNYLLVSRIFDAKIAGVCAILMLCCDTFWNFSLSGLPQMLLMLLFSCGAYFTYRAVEASSEGRVAVTPAVVAGVFFVLMALTHWLAVWIVVGYIIFAAFAFRPRGVVAISILALLMIPATFVMMRNSKVSDTPFGTGLLVLYKGLGESTNESAIMRLDDLSSKPPILDGIMFRTLRTTILQATNIIPFLGGIIVAPIFFIALFHPFKRPSIARFRWAIVAMWVMGALGMSFFGITSNELDSNQMHLVFAPIMTAYGLAFLSILWSRLDFVAANPMFRNLHHVAIVLICAAPLTLGLFPKLKVGLNNRDKGFPMWPPYFAPALNGANGLDNWMKPNQICFSDQPWAVAWYADRMSIWLPTTKKGFESLERSAASYGTPVSGILISPSSHGSGDMRDVQNEYGDFSSLVFDGRVAIATGGTFIYERDQKLVDICKRYPNRIPLVWFDMVYYSDQALRAVDSKETP